MNQLQERKLPPFGRAMRQEFLIHQDNPSLNHGAFGTYPKHVQEALHKYQSRAESNADLWYHRQLCGHLQKIRSQLAHFMSIPDPQDLVFIPNTTSGINGILRSLIFKFKTGGQILHFSTVYPAIKSLVEYLSDSSRGTAHHITPLIFDLTYPISNQELLCQFESFLDKHSHAHTPIEIALIDHLQSSPGALLPVAEIIEILKRRHILCLVDGAHAIGQVDVNISKLAPDFYVTNLHKWLYTARGSAVIYVDKKHQRNIHPPNISYGYTSKWTQERFQNEFFWTGTMDYSSYCTVPAALEFREAIGGEYKIRGFTHNLAVQGGQYLASRFGTRVLEEEEQIGSMVDVELPLRWHDDPRITEDFWKDILLFRFKVYASTCKHGGKWYGRFSAQIYNDVDDFEIAAKTFIKICDDLNTGSVPETVDYDFNCY